VLCPEKALLYPKENILIVADLHFGKANHFRKAGIAVPSQITMEEVGRFKKLIDKYQPKKFIFLGDLFHSNHNVSVELVQQVIENEVTCEFILVQGNHDIMRVEIYTKIGIEVQSEYTIGDILFTHEPIEGVDRYNIHGHLHPAVVLEGQGRQTMRLPCFYFGEKKGILPAYGLFTGMYNLQDLQEDDVVYVIADGEVIRMR
jgi:DNA ligase-associated metallophosphoesterase